jgi:hypothetical protein
MKFAYADPPYIGQAKRHYDCPEVDHQALLTKLLREYEDGWALSCSSPSLFTLIPMVNDIEPRHDCRIGAWIKPFAVFKPGVNPAYAWEPVIWRGGHKRDRTEPTVRDWTKAGNLEEFAEWLCAAFAARDWVSANITLRKGLSGAKPRPFSEWVADLLGVRTGDTVDDLFPGTGACGVVFAERVA